jgi:predicted nucleic acid-binding protein
VSYSIDTSALMEAWVRHYPPDVFPTLWEQIEKLVEAGRLLAIDEVLGELERKSDDLHDWAKQHAGMFISTDEAIMRRAAAVLKQFPSLAEPQSLRGKADPFVIALAMERNLTLVTMEHSRPTKPRIPDVCRQLQVVYTTDRTVSS